MEKRAKYQIRKTQHKQHVRDNITLYSMYWETPIRFKYKYADYIRVASAVLKAVAQSIVEGICVYIPSVGYFHLNKRNKGFPIDWIKTKKYWKKYPEKEKKEFIYFLNAHTGGYVYKIKWTKHAFTRKPKLLGLFGFKPVKSIKSQIGLNILNGREYADYNFSTIMNNREV